MQVQEWLLYPQRKDFLKGMQFEHPKIVMKRFQDQMYDMIEEQVLKSVYQKIKVVRVVVQVVMQNYLKEQKN